MVTPILWFGAVPVFYRVHEDLSPDVNDLERRVTDRTRCLLAVHYFGFPRALTETREFCDSRGLVLIEDCAHCFFGEVDSKPVGSFGHFAIASPAKFFPVFDGGCLVSSMDLPLGARPRRGEATFQTKSLLDVLERSQQYDRMPMGRIWRAAFGIKNALWTRAKNTVPSWKGVLPRAPTAVEGGYDFESRWMDVAMSGTSTLIMKCASSAHIVRGRRANYGFFLKELAKVEGGRPIYPQLGETDVPYVFPFYVDNPSVVFSKLKFAGVPLLRWESAETTTCPVSAVYSENLLMIPCHQELKEDDIEWIASQLILSLAEAGREIALGPL
jgi:dTDP-4-amino-4,6-dideoxygalactose transaminase